MDEMTLNELEDMEDVLAMSWNGQNFARGRLLPTVCSQVSAFIGFLTTLFCIVIKAGAAGVLVGDSHKVLLGWCCWAKCSMLGTTRAAISNLGHIKTSEMMKNLKVCSSLALVLLVGIRVFHQGLW
ncbi:hypothetical protein B0H65DRAFT_439565 [Neurospora tetraspora]|uniref:Uncharacterized protein n=1 Tax=Neurospora tetraspora TaxID=94610 RepID=A0AAE0JKA5_9PEZI|nr:hypothetical protein B0H65DRAFT_439565 [Neurospora tetraspora]